VDVVAHFSTRKGSFECKLVDVVAHSPFDGRTVPDESHLDFCIFHSLEAFERHGVRPIRLLDCSAQKLTSLSAVFFTAQHDRKVHAVTLIVPTLHYIKHNAPTVAGSSGGACLSLDQSGLLGMAALHCSSSGVAVLGRSILAEVKKQKPGLADTLRGSQPPAGGNELRRDLFPPMAARVYEETKEGTSKLAEIKPLWTHQTEAIQRFQTQPLENLIVSLPTGTGKSRIATELAHQALCAQPSKRVLFVAHKGVIVRQLARMARENIPGSSNQRFSPRAL
jgi:hypothetical protein